MLVLESINSTKVEQDVRGPWATVLLFMGLASTNKSVMFGSTESGRIDFERPRRPLTTPPRPSLADRNAVAVCVANSPSPSSTTAQATALFKSLAWYKCSGEDQEKVQTDRKHLTELSIALGPTGEGSVSTGGSTKINPQHAQQQSTDNSRTQR
jgi:hypothetical protein